jgi:iron complex transport system ATP-binding protein
MIKIKNLTYIYPTLWGLRSLDIHIPEGSFSAILGPNGAGKSTLLKVITKILHPYNGEIFIFDKNLKDFSYAELAQLIGYVPQEHNFAFDFTVREILEMGRFPHQKLWERLDPTGDQIIKKMMDLTDTWEFENRSFKALSGGEKKRIMITSALVQEPRILLLDEPTAGLDVHHQLHILQLLKKINRDHQVTIAMVTHDINYAAKYCDYFIFMLNGKIITTGNKELLFDQSLLESVYNTRVKIIRHPVDDEPLILFER